MKKKILVGSIIAVVIILLSSFSSVVSKVSSDEELVELTVEFCGIHNQLHKTTVTKQKAKELNHLFTTIGEKMDAAESQAEVEAIFTDAIIQIEALGLLPHNINVENAQNLITGNLPFCKTIANIYSNTFLKTDNAHNSNKLCLIAGESTEDFSTTWFHGLPFRIAWTYTFYVAMLAVYLNNEELFDLTIGWMILLGLIFALKLFVISINPYSNQPDPFFQPPFMFGGWINYGFQELVFGDTIPAEGWVSTFGLNGNKNWDGQFYGTLYDLRNPLFFFFPGAMSYPGVSGFFGLIFEYDNTLYPRNYLGYAIRVEIGPDPPYVIDIGE